MTSNRPKIKDGFVCIHCKEPFPFPNYNRKVCFDCKKEQVRLVSAKLAKLKKNEKLISTNNSTANIKTKR